jgi:Arc/MetJ-type ribon-helix-helix transcriptional regulator
MAKRSAKDYEEMSRAVESGAYTVRSPMELGATLRMGRPIKGARPAGKTPGMTVRLPESIRVEITHRVKAGESRSESELIRRAVVEYLERHPGSR